MNIQDAINKAIGHDDFTVCVCGEVLEHGNVCFCELDKRDAAEDAERDAIMGDDGGSCEDWPCCGHEFGSCYNERKAERRLASNGTSLSRRELAELMQQFTLY